MAKFVFIVPPLTGHINPTLSLGTVLLERGHDVGWITLDQSLGEKLPPGGELLLIQYHENDQQKKEAEKYLDLITQKVVYGIDSVKFLYEEVLIPLNRHSYEGIAALLDEFEPDLIITDHQMFAGAMAAFHKNLPYATSVTAPAAIKVMDELPKVHEWEVNQITALQQEFGIEHSKNLATSDLLTLIFTSKEFFGEMELPEQFKFVGPVFNRRQVEITFNWEAFHAIRQRSILVSIGTTFDHEHKKSFFSKVVEAFSSLDIHVIVVSDPGLFEAWPKNFTVQKQVPQVKLLPYVAAVVCHGGHNTVCESLMHGLPLVVIPIAYDQSHVAGRVVRVGAGERLNFNRFKAKHLLEAVNLVLENPSYKDAAMQIKQSFTHAGGNETAADLLENALFKTTKALIIT
ncbi:glycosyltransferase [Pedobacter psychrotolerans]|uniref:glycosyltransferase n=1 Tax=Pedobacter psychrotolerans TaxID=1843235 RepID=UPI003F9B7BDE